MLDRFEELRARDKANREQEKLDWINNINVLHNNTDTLVMPMVEIMKEEEDKFISFHITKYTMCLMYSITMYKKDTHNIYCTKEFRKNQITKKYQKQFEELEKYFI